MRIVLAVTVASLVWVGFAVAAAVPSGIIIGQRIGAVKLGESEAQVTTALGRGTPVRVDGNPFRFYPKAGIYVLYPPNRSLPRRVFAVMTRSARYRTRSGIGVGSSLRQLRQAVSVGCHPSGRFVVCYHGPVPLTSFVLSNRKHVTEIAIASN